MGLQRLDGNDSDWHDGRPQVAMHCHLELNLYGKGLGAYRQKRIKMIVALSFYTECELAFDAYVIAEFRTVSNQCQCCIVWFRWHWV